MKKVILISCLFLTLGLTGIFAQNHVGNYSGTLTFTSTEFSIDESLLNMQISNQELQTGENIILLENIPILKEGDPVNIGFPDTEFATDGTISAPPVAGSFNDIPLTLTITSGNISGNTINLTFRMVDTETDGTVVDVTANYSGTKKENVGINEISVADDKIIIGYYSITGQKLNREPQNGLYIVMYDNGKSEKVFKK